VHVPATKFSIRKTMRPEPSARTATSIHAGLAPLSPRQQQNDRKSTHRRTFVLRPVDGWFDARELLLLMLQRSSTRFASRAFVSSPPPPLPATCSRGIRRSPVARSSCPHIYRFISESMRPPRTTKTRPDIGMRTAQIS
jgi:hypothetical protein